MRRTETHSPRDSSSSSGRLAQLSAARDDNLFVYGSLQFPDVLRVLLGRVPTVTPATVQDWQVTALPKEVYPGLVPGGGPTSGFVLSDLTPNEWEIVDAFENPVYELTRLPTDDGDDAWAYTSPPSSTPAFTPWDPAEFLERHHSDYLKRCAAWLERFRSCDVEQ